VSALVPDAVGHVPGMASSYSTYEKCYNSESFSKGICPKLVGSTKLVTL